MDQTSQNLIVLPLHKGNTQLQYGNLTIHSPIMISQIMFGGRGFSITPTSKSNVKSAFIPGTQLDRPRRSSVGEILFFVLFMVLLIMLFCLGGGDPGRGIGPIGRNVGVLTLVGRANSICGLRKELKMGIILPNRCMKPNR